MNVRLRYAELAPGVYDAMDGLDRYLQTCALERPLVLLIQLRASQINGCSFCIHHHTSDARKYGGHERSNHA